MANSSRIHLIGQALFVVFLWSISKIVLKMGLAEIPPYLFVALIQLVAVASLALYGKFTHKRFSFNLEKEDLSLAIIAGLVGYVGANLFMIIGLQYVTGATAGLIAASSSIFAVLMGWMFLAEKPKVFQYLGMAGIVLGSYIFLSNQIISGSMVGIGLLVLAEIAFAYSGSLVRKISLDYKADVSLPIALIGSAIGAIVLVPIALAVDGFRNVTWHWETVLWVVTVGLIFAFAGMMWNAILDKIRLAEASVISNTMLIQVAILSIIFLHESLNANNLIGGLIVLIGAVVADGSLILPQILGMRGEGRGAREGT